MFWSHLMSLLTLGSLAKHRTIVLEIKKHDPNPNPLAPRVCFFPCYFFKCSCKNYHKKEINLPLKHRDVTSTNKVILIMNSPQRELLESNDQNLI